LWLKHSLRISGRGALQDFLGSVVYISCRATTTKSGTRSIHKSQQLIQVVLYKLQPAGYQHRGNPNTVLTIAGENCFCAHGKNKKKIEQEGYPFSAVNCPTSKGSRLTSIPAVGAPHAVSRTVKQTYHNVRCRSIRTQEGRQNTVNLGKSRKCTSQRFVEPGGRGNVNRSSWGGLGQLVSGGSSCIRSDTRRALTCGLNHERGGPEARSMCKPSNGKLGFLGQM
jgi:hypothetical protein